MGNPYWVALPLRSSSKLCPQPYSIYGEGMRRRSMEQRSSIRGMVALACGQHSPSKERSHYGYSSPLSTLP